MMDTGTTHTGGPAAPSGALTSEFEPMGRLGLLALVEDHAATLMWEGRRSAPGTTGRTCRLLHLGDLVEVWMIRWPPGGRLELHDHGGSTGALCVVEGTLDEHHVTGDGRVRRRRLGAGRGVAFGTSHVHDVTNHSHATATSIHAYSPPMASMRFYLLGPEGLTVSRTQVRGQAGWEL